MLEACRDADFAQEAIGADRHGQVGREHLDGDFAAVLPVVREVYPRHASAADFPVDVVSAGERRA
jgi:hypothetical protein